MEPKSGVYSIVYHSLVLGMAVSTALFSLALGLQLLRALGVAAPDPTLLLRLGVIVMILTPVSRVVVSIAAFLRERDYRFAAITLVVLATLICSILLGLSGLEQRG